MTLFQRFEIGLYKFFLWFGRPVPNWVANSWLAKKLFLRTTATNQTIDSLACDTDDKSRLNVYRFIAQNAVEIKRKETLKEALENGYMLTAFHRVQQGKNLEMPIDASDMKIAGICTAINFINAHGASNDQKQALYESLIEKYLSAKVDVITGTNRVLEIVAANYREFAPIIVKCHKNDNDPDVKAKLAGLFSAIADRHYTAPANATEEVRQDFKKKADHIKHCYVNTPSVNAKQLLLNYIAGGYTVEGSIIGVFNAAKNDRNLLSWFSETVCVFKIDGEGTHLWHPQEKPVFQILHENLHNKELLDIVVKGTGMNFVDLMKRVISANALGFRYTELAKGLLTAYRNEMKNDKQAVLEYVLGVSEGSNTPIKMVDAVLEGLGERGDLKFSDEMLRNLNAQKYAQPQKYGMFHTTKVSALRALLKRDFLTVQEVEKMQNDMSTNDNNIPLATWMWDHKIKTLGLIAGGGILPLADMLQNVRNNVAGNKQELFTADLLTKWVSAPEGDNAKPALEFTVAQCDDLLDDLYNAKKAQQEKGGR